MENYGIALFFPSCLVTKLPIKSILILQQIYPLKFMLQKNGAATLLKLKKV